MTYLIERKIGIEGEANIMGGIASAIGGIVSGIGGGGGNPISGILGGIGNLFGGGGSGGGQSQPQGLDSSSELSAIASLLSSGKDPSAVLNEIKGIVDNGSGGAKASGGSGIGGIASLALSVLSFL